MLNYDDLELAFEFSSSASPFEDSAYIDKETGQVIYISDAIDEEPPEDIFENEKYVLVPDKRESGLGKPLALEFTAEYLPSDTNMVTSIFHSRGAYSRFKSLLEDRKQLETWYEYESTAVKNVLLQWCKEHGVEVSI